MADTKPLVGTDDFARALRAMVAAYKSGQQFPAETDEDETDGRDVHRPH